MKRILIRSRRSLAALLLAAALACTGCAAQTAGSASTAADTLAVQTAAAQSSAAAIDTDDLFTDRDLETDYDAESAVSITLTGDSAACDSDAVEISGGTVTITDEGVYLLTGTLTDGMIVVDADDSDKVQLVLNGVSITSASSAAVYVREADKVFVTTAADSENYLANGGAYVAIDDNNIDAVIFSKSDLTLNGTGTLAINAAAGHGIVSKDDLVLTSGTYVIMAASHGLSGKDSVRIAGGSYTITAGKDGIHAENKDDDTLGWLYIADGTFTIAAGDDGMHAATALTIDGGIIQITESYEGIEGLTIDINGGTIDIVSSDDGLNAAGGTDSSGTGGMGDDVFAVTEGAYITIAGGTLHINASGDGIDSNGDLYVTGGEIYVSGPTDSGNGALDYNGSAAITGGVFVAAGSSGMAQNFGSGSTQGCALVSAGGTAGSTITLCDADGNVLITWQADKAYDCVLVSCPGLTEGGTYTLTADGTAAEFTLDSLVYGSAGQGGMGGQGGMDGTAPAMDGGSAPAGGRGAAPDGQDGGTPPEQGTAPEGDRGTPPEQGAAPEGGTPPEQSGGTDAPAAP